MASIILSVAKILLILTFILSLAFAVLQLAKVIVGRRSIWMNERGLSVLVGGALSMLLNAPVWMYLQRLAEWLGGTLSEAAAGLANWGGVSAECAESCVSAVLATAGRDLGLFVAARLSDLADIYFPFSSALAFLVTFVALVLLLRFCAKRFRESDERPERFRPVINLTFLSVVALAFYLSLTALLAIPLMQSQVVAQGFSADDLQKALAESSFSEAELAQRFPEIVLDTSTASRVAGTMDDQVWDAVDAMLGGYQRARNAALDQINGLTRSAQNAYKAKNAQHLEGKETVEHFAALLSWYQSEKSRLNQDFDRCRADVQAVSSSAGTQLKKITSPAPEQGGRVGPWRFDMDQLYSDAVNAQLSCSSSQRGFNPIPPDRRARGSDLGIIGTWTQWLLATESVPLINIIGLIGFSLLGAALSRIVRSGADRTLDRLSLTDVLKVLASGVAAAMVVFLASYGGLAVLGETASDPNPYVIFALCLTGAIFSESIWEWARGWLQDQFPAGDARTGKTPEAPKDPKDPKDPKESKNPDATGLPGNSPENIGGPTGQES